MTRKMICAVLCLFAAAACKEKNPLMFASGIGANGNATLVFVLLFLVPSLWMVFMQIEERFFRKRWRGTMEM